MSMNVISWWSYQDYNEKPIYITYYLLYRDWGKKTPYDTSYSVQFLIRNDSLFFNNIYKGKKY